MRIRVEDEAVDPRAKSPVACALEPRGRFRPLALAGLPGESLGLEDVVELAITGVQDAALHAVSERIARPEFGHHPVHVWRDLAGVERPAVRLAHEADFLGGEHALHGDEQHVAVEVGHGAVEVRAEFFRLPVAAHHAAGEGRQERADRIAAAFLEFLGHQRRPRGRARLIAVEQHVPQAGSHQRAEVFLQFPDDMVEVKFHRLLVHLVALQSHHLPLVRLGQGAHGGVAETIDRPFPAGGGGPFEAAFRIHVFCQVDDRILGDDTIARHREHGDVAPVGFAAFDHGFLQFSRLLVDHRKQHVAARIDRGFGKDGVKGLPRLHLGA